MSDIGPLTGIQRAGTSGTSALTRIFERSKPKHSLRIYEYTPCLLSPSGTEGLGLRLRQHNATTGFPDIHLAQVEVGAKLISWNSWGAPHFFQWGSGASGTLIKRGTGAMDAVCTGNLNPDVVRRGSGVMR